MKNIGKISIILGVLCIISFSLAGALFFSNPENYQLEDNSNYISINDFERADYIGVKEVEVNFVSEDTTIEVVPGEDFIFNFTGVFPKSKYDEPPKLEVVDLGNKIIVKIIRKKQNIIFGTIYEDYNLYIGIPEKYESNLGVNGISGDIKITNLNLNELYAESVSGEISLKNVICKDVGLHSVSGEVYSLDSEGISSVKTTSGDVDFDNYNVKGDLNIETVSGDVELDIRDDSSIDVYFDSISGDFKESSKTRGGEYKIKVKTTSGDLSVY